MVARTSRPELAGFYVDSWPLWSAVVSILAFKPLAAQRSWKYSNVGRLESAEDGHHARGILYKF